MRAAKARQIAALGILCLAGWAGLGLGSAAAYSLDRVTLEECGTGLILRIVGGPTGVSHPHDVFSLSDPWRVVIDLYGADSPVAVAWSGAPAAAPQLLTALRSSSYRQTQGEPVVRYVLESTEPLEYQTEALPEGLLVTVRPAGGSRPNPLTSSLGQDGAPPMGPADPASPAPPAAPSPAPEKKSPPQVAPPPPPPAAPPMRAMNLDVQGADIRTVFRSIAEYGGTNIVADRGVEGPVTVRLVQVPWRQALDIVCQSAGLITLGGDDFIRVATLKTWQEEGIEKESSDRKKEDLVPVVTKIFNIQYATAKELAESVVFALSPRGKVQADDRTNSLLVSDFESRVDEIGRLVSKLDTETRQVEIVARLVDVDKTTARQLGIDWSLQNLHSTSERISGSAAVDEHLTDAPGTLRLGLVRGFGNLDATIEAMEQANKAELISNPKITTVNNRKAKILVGKEIPLIVLDKAGNPITELKRVGITLEVTPYINSENRITMDLHPEVSDLSQQATVQGGLIFTTSLADTRVMVNDGETAVIGGLLRSSETHFEEGIPILRSIPLLGALFRKSDVRKESRELLIFVTPRVVEPVAQKQETPKE